MDRTAAGRDHGYVRIVHLQPFRTAGLDELGAVFGKKHAIVS
jgi:hypothetical protein